MMENDRKKVRSDNLKHAATALTAAAAIVTAVTSFLKLKEEGRRQDQLTKDSYSTLSESVKELSDQSKKQHDDMVALRAYVQGMNDSSRKSMSQMAAMVNSAASAAASSPAAPRPQGVRRPPEVRPPEVRPDPPLPEIAPKPKFKEPPSYDVLKMKSEEKL